MPELNWTCVDYTDLSLANLYAILRLRSEVFVVEQQCAYQDLDDKDQAALHVLGHHEDKLLCYARLLAPGKKYQEPSLGRVVNSLSLRGQGAGKILVEQSLDYCHRCWPGQGVRISAQQRLQNFYEDFGFDSVSEPYLEDGIPHIEMLLKADSPAS